MKWGRLADGIGMERNAAKVQFGHLLGKMKTAVAAPEGYGHITTAAIAPSVTTSTGALVEEYENEHEEQEDEGLDEPANTTTVPTPECKSSILVTLLSHHLMK